MKKRVVFNANPWGLTCYEARVVWLLTVLQPKDVAARLGLTVSGVRAHLHTIYARMGVTHGAAAAVEFDRWWQVQKRHFDDAIVRLFEVELLEPKA